MEVIYQEYFKVVDIIGDFDSHLMMIKGWSITVCVGLIGLALQEKFRPMLLAACLSSLCFFVVDLKYKEYQTNYYERMVEIETCLSKPEVECADVSIHKSWENRSKTNSMLHQLGKFNVFVPYIFIFLIPLFLYFNPKFIEKIKAKSNGNVKPGDE